MIDNKKVWSLIMISTAKPANFTPQMKQVLTIITQKHDWIGRGEVARALGKATLNQWHIGILRKLVEDGYIEERRVERRGAIGFEFQYRCKNGDTANAT
jgi:predicted transcriptional regulator